MVNSVIAGRINRGRRGIVSSVRTLNKYLVSDNGIEVTVTARDADTAIAIATVRDNRISDNATATLAGSVEYTFNQYKN